MKQFLGPFQEILAVTAMTSESILFITINGQRKRSRL